MNKHHIVTTINPPTAVTCSVKGNLITAHEQHLIVCKGSIVEIYNLLADGIKLFTQFTIHGVICCVQTLALPERTTCSLFILTEQNRFTILSFNATILSFTTESHGILEQINARVTDQPISTVVDSKHSTILVSSHTGIVFAIPFNKLDIKGKGRESKMNRFQPCSMQTHEFDFLSMACVKGFPHATLTALLGEINELKSIKTFRYSVSSHTEMSEIEKSNVKVESTAHKIVAVPEPIGGVLVIGEYIVSYHDLAAGGTRELSIDLVLITACTFLDQHPTHCIMGDSSGLLYYLTLETTNSKVTGISSLIIGQAPIATSIVDLGNNLLYIGSSQGDPCVAKMVIAPGTRPSIQILQTFPNLGPILDFCLFDYDGQGKQTMVCCSGVDNDGSLRIVENGVGFIEQYTIPIPLVKNVWNLSNDTLLITTVMDTLLLKQNPQKALEMRECRPYSALILDEITLAAGVTQKGCIIQVTSTSVRLVQSVENGKLISEWNPPFGAKIALAKVNSTQCVLCYGKGMLVYLDITDNAITQKCVKQFKDVTCISLSPKHENGTGKDLVLIGTWLASKVYLLDLSNLNTLLEHITQSATGPKDILLIRLQKVLYFMILLGDGQMLSYHMDVRSKVPALFNARQTMVGTYCTAMYPFTHDGELKIFVAGIRPTIVTSWHQKLFFSAVNLKNVYALAPLHDQLILMTESGLLFGKPDAAQKLHHHKIELNNEMPMRIQYMPKSKSLAVSTILNQKDLVNGFNIRTGKIQILDAQTFQVLDTFNLPENEMVESMTRAQFIAYPNQEFLFVGTMIENADDPDQSQGRIMVFDLKENNKCEMVTSTQLPGIIYNIKPFQNSIVASVNGSIYTLQSFHPEIPLEFKSNLHNNVLALRLDTREDRVLVADLMQSVSLLSMVNQDPLTLKLMAVDNKPTWMTAVKFVNENVYIGSDDRNNVFTLYLDENNNHRSTKAATNALNQNGLLKLNVIGGFHIGSMVNCFQEGILSDHKRHDENEIYTTESPFTFATVHGSIGTIKTISAETFHFFKQIQDSILKQSNYIGKLDHTNWRNYKPKINTNQWQETETNYLDGDLLKSFQYMNRIDKENVLKSLPSHQYKAIDIEQFINSVVL